MGRKFINSLADRDEVDEVYQVFGKQLRPNRNGNLYLQVQLCDRTGAMSARMWNASDSVFRAFEDGDFVRVAGTAQLYQGAMQVIATHMAKVPKSDVDAEEFIPESPLDLDKLSRRLSEILRSITQPSLRALAETFLMDDAFMRKFCRAPAGIKNHHAYLGGLMEHVVQLLELCLRLADLYPTVHRDLLILGTFLHDMGKTEELSYDMVFSYTDEGQLLGHIIQAISLLDRKVQEAETLTGEPIPPELVMRLKHMIISHHGEYEFGSPKLPMTLEAVVLTHLDSLDAKLHNFQQLIREDPNADSPWTLYQSGLGRKLYKGLAPDANDTP